MASVFDAYYYDNYTRVAILDSNHTCSTLNRELENLSAELSNDDEEDYVDTFPAAELTRKVDAEGLQHAVWSFGFLLCDNDLENNSQLLDDLAFHDRIYRELAG